MKPKIKNDIYIREIKGEKVIYNEKKGRVHFLNQTATLIFDLCDGSNTREDIISHLVDNYEVNRETAEKDVGDILENLKENRILEKVPL